MANSERPANHAAIHPEDVMKSHPAHQPDDDSERCRRCCLNTFFVTVVPLIFTIVILHLLRNGGPKLPDIRIESAPSASVLNVSAGRVTAEWDVIFSVRNYNKHLQLSYHNITAVAYLDKHMKHVSPTSAAALSPFEQHGKEVTNVSARMEPFTMAVNRWSSYEDAAAGAEATGMVALNVRLTAMVSKPNGRGWFWPPKSGMTADCRDLRLVFSTKSRKSLMVENSVICEVRGKWFHLSDAWSTPVVFIMTILFVFSLFSLMCFCGASLHQR